jgi:D-alanyl-D-alanine carboxypeptidase/D-alanyl-D-alanine-endopeptidase (penicillin-binding protein 4)
MARRASHPVVVLACMAVTVSMALIVLWQWADARTLIAAEPTIAATADPAVALATPVLSVRRAPTVLSRELNTAQFAVDLQPLLDQVGTTSCVAVSVDGRPVAAKNGTTPVLPASTVKLLVAASALEVLGPGYTFRTGAYGTVENGVVAGDLVLLGGGDPVLTTQAWITNGFQRYPPINVTRLEALADALVTAGVTRVDGRVLGDGTRYDDEFFNPTWADGIRVTEAGPYDALLVDDGRVGGVPTSDPALGAAQVFTRLLRDRSITVGQGAAVGTGDLTNEIAGIDSAPLGDILREMLETSDDNTAEMLVKELGVANGTGGTTAAGLAIVTDQLGRWGVPLDGVVLVDGSGLSRENSVTCDALLAVLEHGSLDDAVGQGLPVAAVSGTLQDEFVATPMAGVLRAKTGSLTGLKALAGYVPVAGGSVIEFALVLDQPGANDPGVYRAVWEGALAQVFATYPSGPSADELAPR